MGAAEPKEGRGQPGSAEAKGAQGEQVRPFFKSASPFRVGASPFRVSFLATTSQKGNAYKRGKEQGHRSLRANRAQKDPGRMRPCFLKTGPPFRVSP